MNYPNDPGEPHWNQNGSVGERPDPYGYQQGSSYGNQNPPQHPYPGALQQPDPYAQTSQRPYPQQPYQQQPYQQPYQQPGYPAYGPGQGGDSPYPSQPQSSSGGSGGTNGLAIAALVAAFIVAPVGIVLGHFSLSEIKRNRQQGRPIAVTALVLGYLFTIIAVVAVVLALTGFFTTDDTDSTTVASKSSTTTEPTTTEPTSTESGETIPPGYTQDPSDTLANRIRTTNVGACIHREANGSQLTDFYRTACDSSSATDRVYRRTENTGDCNGNWVQIGPSAYFSRAVVLCLNSV